MVNIMLTPVACSFYGSRGDRVGKLLRKQTHRLLEQNGGLSSTAAAGDGIAKTGRSRFNQVRQDSIDGIPAAHFQAARGEFAGSWIRFEERQ
jgi:hypothetical protein